jgi:hypothetical protein
MLHKPAITQVISATGTVMEAQDVAKDIVNATLSGSQIYTISSGLDGALLKLLHGGMSPVNNALEVTAQIFLASVGRLLAVFYLFYWQYLVRSHLSKHDTTTNEKRSGLVAEEEEKKSK